MDFGTFDTFSTFCIFCVKKKKHVSYACPSFKNKKFISKGLEKIKRNLRVYKIFVERCIKYKDLTLFQKLIKNFPNFLTVKYEHPGSYLLGLSIYYIDKHGHSCFLAKIISLSFNMKLKSSVDEILKTVEMLTLKLSLRDLSLYDDYFSNTITIPIKLKSMIYLFIKSIESLERIDEMFKKLNMEIANIMVAKKLTGV